MTRFPALLAALAILSAPGLVPGTALAQDATAPATEPATTDPATDPATAPLPEMAEIEQAWARGDYVFVRKGLARHAVETGAPLAQYRYGRVLLEGRGGPLDPAAAAQWLERAVAQGHLEATTLLARVYLSGYDPAPARDAARAVALLSDAAARGDAEAQYYLALLYRAGDGVAQDLRQAFIWMRAAAEKFHTEAQFELSRLYARGLGTEASPQQAEHWLREAATAGHVQAQYFLGQALGGRDPAPPEALDWTRRAAEAGLPIAQRELGMAYLTGRGVAPNSAEALRWLDAAAAAGDPGAWSNLGYAYASGTGVARDDAKAAHWYEQASKAGLGRATLALARFHETGRGVETDIDTAIALYRTALDQGAAKAAERLGQLAAEGTLTGRVAPQRALPWAAAAAEAGHASAWVWLEAQAETLPEAGLYLGRLTLDSDPATAAAWLDRAAMAGVPEAQFELGRLYTTGGAGALDYIRAHQWRNIAASLGHGPALELRETVAQLMTPEEVAQAQRAARDWLDTGQPQPPTPEAAE